MATCKLTNSDRVLLALASAAGNSTERVAYEEIVVESWRKYPEHYSLRNYPEYPDSSDQHKRLYGELKKRGYVVTLRDRFFRLTEAGLEQALKLQGAISDVQSTAAVGRLSRDSSRLVQRATVSEAYAKWTRGRASHIVDFDARGYFGVSVTMTRRDRQVCVDGMMNALDAARINGHPSAPELTKLANFLLERFPEVVGHPCSDSRGAST